MKEAQQFREQLDCQGFFRHNTTSSASELLRENKMKRVSAIVAASALLYLGTSAHADVFHMSSGITSLEMVTIGDVGNAPDTRYVSPGKGSVGYSYSIGKFEITSAQYSEFLNKVAKSDPNGLYHNAMWSDPQGPKIQRSGSSGNYSYSVAADYANRPVNCVSFPSACRFVNWLHNGQPTGPQSAATTESGAYHLIGVAEKDITRSAGARFFLPSADEWYKAAYYKAGGTNAGYWTYPTQSNTEPATKFVNPDPGNHVTAYSPYTDAFTLSGPFYTTIVGEWEHSASAYGTYDQGGNVWEWTEAAYKNPISPYRYPMLLGGSWGSDVDCSWAASVITIDYLLPGIPYGNRVNTNTGFRIAGVVPEPSSLLALLCGIGGMSGIIWKKK